MEMATRAKRELILILAEPEKERYKKYYQKRQGIIKAAADEGLIDLQVSESDNDIITIIMIIIMKMIIMMITIIILSSTTS